MLQKGRLLTLILVALTFGLTACGGDDDGGSATPTTTTTTTSTSTTLAGLEQPAIWPAADVYFSTPAAAATSFVEQVLGVPAVLGEFQAGDSRSGEIQVFSPGEGASATRVERGLLLLRQLGSRSGWFVLAAENANATITTPVQGAKVVASQLTVSGKARGFEANVVVSARRAGTAQPTLGSVVTQGGAMETPEPYSVVLDLAGAASGDVVMLLVRGGTGLETDPGEFGAIAVVIA